MAIEFESDPAERCAHQPCARIVHLESVGATQVHGHGRRSVDHELAWGRPDICMNGSAIEGNPLQVCTHGQQTQTRARIDLDPADIVGMKAGVRQRICFKDLTDPKAASSFVRSDGLASDARWSYHTGYVPTR